MNRWTSTLIAAALVFIAGCAGPSATDRDAPGPASDGSPRPTLTGDPGAAYPEIVGRPFLDYKDCSELNLIVTVPADDFGDTGPLRPKPVDPLGQTLQFIITGMGCETLDASGRSITKPVAAFGMMAVEPHPELRIPGVNSYYWLGFVATEHVEVASVLEARGVDTSKAKVTLKFESLGPNAKARGTFNGMVDDFQVNIESVMAGSPSQGAAGSLGLYTFQEEASGLTLWMHRVNFTAYKFYDRGAALVRPGFTPLANIAESPEPTLATHNLDYGVRFDFDQGLWEK